MDSQSEELGRRGPSVPALTVGFVLLFVVAPLALLLTGTPPASLTPGVGVTVGVTALLGGLIAALGGPRSVMIGLTGDGAMAAVPRVWWFGGLVSVAVVAAACTPGPDGIGNFVLILFLAPTYAVAVLVALRRAGATMVFFWLLVLLALLGSLFVASAALLGFALWVSIRRQRDGGPPWGLVLLAAGAVTLSALTPAIKHFGLVARFSLVADEYEEVLGNPSATYPPFVSAVQPVGGDGKVAFTYPIGFIDSSLGVLYDPTDDAEDGHASLGGAWLGAHRCEHLQQHWYWCVFD